MALQAHCVLAANNIHLKWYPPTYTIFSATSPTQRSHILFRPCKWKGALNGLGGSTCAVLGFPKQGTMNNVHVDQLSCLMVPTL